jgi:hypothetical protein
VIILALVYAAEGLLEVSLQQNPPDKAMPLFFLKGDVWGFSFLQKYWEEKHVGVREEVEGLMMMDTMSHKLISVLHFLDLLKV